MLKTGDNSITDKNYYILAASLGKTSTKLRVLYPKGVFLRTKGGIGNQLYQYACHYALARKHNVPLYIDQRNQRAQHKTRNMSVEDRSFVLDSFNVPLFPWNTIDETWPLPNIVDITDSDLLSGSYNSTSFRDSLVSLHVTNFCQSEAYFAQYRDELRLFFTLKDGILTEAAKSWAEFIKTAGNIGETVAIHIRRGDFVSYNTTTPLSFFTTAISSLREQLISRNNKDIPISLFIFSDDAIYVRNVFLKALRETEGIYNIHIVSDPSKFTSLEELYMSTKCKNFVIPNSTFAWWAAYLAKHPNKIVYAAHLTTEHVKWLYVTESLERQQFYLWQYKHIYYPSGWNAIYPPSLL